MSSSCFLHHRRMSDSLLKEFAANGPAPAESIETVEKHFGCTLPPQYKNFMTQRDGGEGFIGAQYLVLWRLGELIEFNRDYEAARYAPGLLLFGSNGAGEAFAFDTRVSEDMRIRMVPIIGMSLRDATPVADTFENFLVCLDESAGTLP
jgi:SMI1 / KNR4 family (SUKH-1)